MLCMCRENEAEGVCNRFAAALTSTSDAARGKGTSGASTACKQVGMAV